MRLGWNYIIWSTWDWVKIWMEICFSCGLQSQTIHWSGGRAMVGRKSGQGLWALQCEDYYQFNHKLWFFSSYWFISAVLLHACHLLTSSSKISTPTVIYPSWKQTRRGWEVALNSTTKKYYWSSIGNTLLPAFFLYSFRFTERSLSVVVYYCASCFDAYLLMGAIIDHTLALEL